MTNELNIENLNIVSQEILITPSSLKAALPVTDRALETVTTGRNAIRRILDRDDHRLIVVIGPCSIHDTEAAMDYARRLKTLAGELSDTLLIVMRVYFEKPRTTVGWKGLINDPDLDGSFRIDKGLRLARRVPEGRLLAARAI